MTELETMLTSVEMMPSEWGLSEFIPIDGDGYEGWALMCEEMRGARMLNSVLRANEIGYIRRATPREDGRIYVVVESY